MKKNILKMLRSKQVTKDDTTAEAIMRGVVKEWISNKGHILEKGESEVDAKKRKKANRKAILKGDMAIGNVADQMFDEQMKSAVLSAQLEKLKPLKTFKKTPQEQRVNAKKGGDAKHAEGYKRFKEWVNETNFDVKSYEEISNEKLSITLDTFKHNGKEKPFKAAPKTADKYRKIYLAEIK